MRGKPWTQEDTKTLILSHSIGCTDDMIAKTTGHHVDTVWQHRTDLGLAPNYRNTYAPWESIPALSRRAIAAACGRMAA